MGFQMKRGNKKLSYQDIMSEANQEFTDATEEQRKANVEEEKVEDPTPGKFVGKLIEIGTDMMKADAAAVEKANNNRIAAASIQRR